MCIVLLLYAAGIIREGVALRQWDEAGTVMSPSDDRPWVRTGLVEGLVLIAMMIWTPMGLSGASRRWSARTALARALVFQASAACLLIAVILSGLRSASQPVAPAYRCLLAGEVLIAPLGFWWGGRLLATCRGDAKTKESGYDELDA